MKIVNNFLKEEDFKKIQLMFFNEFFPWYIQVGVNFKEDGHRQFVTLFLLLNFMLILNILIV
jgi:hypothetical protein